jgi:glyoxylase-like metal-dependent hydrolase (beta-lactamase superfamily II)/ferredoxin
MASRDKRLPANVDGDIYVDSTCIDCDTCRWVAPATFDEVAEQSRVYRQPQTPEELQRALMALVACPTASIGMTQKHDLKPVIAAFPELIEATGNGAARNGTASDGAARDAGLARAADGVYYCGFHHEASFGAASYLIVRPGGNVLVDSPRFATLLVKRIEALGGVGTLFLTHQDDIADHRKFAEHFGCERVMHADDVGPETSDVERQIEGLEPVALADDLLVIPTPGHTKGSACLLHADKFLFTGDHLAWSPRLKQVYGFRGATWHSWPRLVESTKRLQAYRFEWILPGHGRRCHFPADEMAEQMKRCVAWMEKAR